MHSALFVAKFPDRHGVWDEFIKRIAERTSSKQGVQRLAETVWLVNVQSSMSGLAALVAHADTLAVSYGILPLEHEPRWLPAGFDSKPKLGP